MAGRLIGAWNPAEDSDGLAMSGAKLYTYVAGTTTNKATYPSAADADAATNPLSNPVVADSAGRFPDLWAPDGGVYDLKWTTAGEVQVKLFEDIAALGESTTGAIMRDFGADGRLNIESRGGVTHFEGGPASPDNTGGAVRLGGWNGSQAETGEIDAAATEATGTFRALGGILNAPPRNRIINPDGQIYQREVASTSDDVYCADRWYALTQTAAITPAKLSDVSSGTPFMLRLTQAQASAQRMGIAQIIEAADCKDLRAKVIAMNARVRCSSAQAIRYALLEWTGAADTVTSDVVNSWTNGTFTAGQFFNSTTLNVLAVGSITPLAATLTDLPDISATMGGSGNNLILMIWTEGTAAQNVTLDIAQVQLVEGSACPDYAPRSKGDELRLCQRFMFKTYAEGVAPGTASSAAGVVAGCGVGTAAGNLILKCPFPVSMHHVPTMTYYSYNGVAGYVFGTDANNHAVATYVGAGPNGVAFNNTAVIPAVGTGFYGHVVAIAEL